MTDGPREIPPGSALDRPIRPRYRPVTEKNRADFLAYLEKGLTVREAAELAGHAPNSFYDICRREPEFGELKNQAMQVGTDRLEEEARRRAVEGYLEPVVGKVAPGIDGHVVDHNGEPMWVTRYDSRLLEVLLKGRRPEYRDSHKVDITNQTLNLSVEDRSASIADLARVLREVGVGPEQIEDAEFRELPDGRGGAS